MEFLKLILGDELYQQVVDKINLHNGTPENKDKQVKLANLAEGNYVAKEKYASLEATHNSKLSELDQANTLIKDLQKSVKNDEALQGKITAYETQMQELQSNFEKKLQETKRKSAIKVALLEAKVDDVDYLTYKLEQKLSEDGKSLELDENDNIKDWNDLLGSLKTQFPQHFNNATDKKINPLPLGKGDPRKTTPTREDFLKMGYNERVALKQENEQLYKNLANKE